MEEYSDYARIASGRTVSYGGKTDRERQQTVAGGKTDRERRQTVAGGKTNRERQAWGPGTLAITPPNTSSRSLASKFSTKYKPGDYGMYRRTLVGYVGAMKGKKKDAPAVAAKAVKAVPAASAVVRNVVTEKLTPVKAAANPQPTKPARTTQSAFSRQRANAMNRTNQPVGPMGGGRGGGFGGGGGRSGGSLSGQGNGGRQTGTSRTGGTRGNEPAGPKRG